MIAGLETPDEGKVVLAGEDVTRVAPQERGVGFVFQHYAAFKHMTVWENVAFGLKIRRRPRAEVKQRVAELLELVQLARLGDRYPAQLSGGQRQRMGLARALAVDPKVLLLDEPFGALDARVRKELRLWLRRLHDETHTTTVIVTHDQEEAMEVADCVVVMNAGRIEQTAPPRELYDNPANEFVMSFVGPVNRLGDTFIRPHDVELLLEPERLHAGGDGAAPRSSRLRGPRRARARRRRDAFRATDPRTGRRAGAAGGADRLRPPDAADRLRGLVRLPGVRVGRQLLDRDRQLAARQIGDRDLLQNGAQVRAHRDPDFA